MLPFINAIVPPMINIKPENKRVFRWKEIITCIANKIMPTTIAIRPKYLIYLLILNV